MCARAVTVLALTALIAACEKMPTTVVEMPLSAQFSAAGAPRFTGATATGPGGAGELLLSFSMAGMGSKASDLISGAATQDGIWACRTVVGEFDHFPAPQVTNAQATSTATAVMKNGQLTGSVTLSAPANALTCSPGAPGVHTPVLVSVQYGGVQVSHPDAGSLAIPGIFQRSFFTIPAETPPYFTDFSPAATDLTIGAAPTLTLVNYSATIQNDAGPLTDIIAQLWITQGSAYRAAGGASVDCGGAAGELPTGTCDIHGTAGATNTGSGGGTLVPGPAVLEIDLRMSPGVRTLAGWRVNVTLH